VNGMKKERKGMLSEASNRKPYFSARSSAGLCATTVFGSRACIPRMVNRRKKVGKLWSMIVGPLALHDCL
jgi:hypothetical protein